MKKYLLSGASLLLLALLVEPGVAEPPAAKVLPLPSADQKMLDDLLGKGVVGKAIPAEAITKPTDFLPLKDGKQKFRVTGGKKKGGEETHVVHETKKLNRPGEESRWRYTIEGGNVTYLNLEKDGSIWITSATDHEQGVLSRFLPREPGLLAMKPGEVRKSKIDVKVYDLSDLKDVTHSGSLNVNYTYVGAYQVKVPAGTFNAVLIKWHYKGKVGPASVEDTQLRLFAKKEGLLASIDKKHISAFLLYRSNAKFGKVLVSD